jgi:hypothetical protein
VALYYKQLSEKSISNQLYINLKSNLIAILFQKNDAYYIVSVNNEAVLNEFKKYQLDIISAPDSLISILKRGNEISYTYYPDSLLQQLAKDKITYVITANIRRNPAQKSGDIINTVERYMYFIQEKYPNILEKVVQMGTDDNEPASLIRINYERYGLQGMLKDSK